MMGLLSGLVTGAAATAVSNSAAAIVGGAARLTAGAVIAKVGTDLARPVVEKIIDGIVGVVTRR